MEGPNKMEEVLKEMHAGHCGSHTRGGGGRMLFEQLVSMDYFWPTMETDAMDLVRSCEACQRLGNLIHALAVGMGSVTSSWPFHTWSIELIGPITPRSKGKIWIVAATKNFTKRSEAIAIRRATLKAVRSCVGKYHMPLLYSQKNFIR